MPTPQFSPQGGHSVMNTGGPMADTSAPSMGPLFPGGGQMLNQFLPMMMQQFMPGVMPTQFTPQQSFYDQQAAMQFQQQSMWAQQTAQQADQQAMMQNLVGLGVMQDPMKFSGEQREQQLQNLQSTAGMLTQAGQFLVPPHILNQLYGSRGSAMVASQAFLRGGQLMTGPTQGAGGLTGQEAGLMSAEITEQLFGVDSAAQMGGQNMGEVGLTFEALSRRGLVQGGAGANREAQFAQIADTEFTQSGVSRLAERLGTDTKQIREQIEDIRKIKEELDEGRVSIQEALDRVPDLDAFALQSEARRVSTKLEGMSSVMDAAAEVFGPNASQEQLVQGVQNLTQGGLNRMTPGEVAREVRLFQATSRQTGISLPALMGLQAQAAQVGDQLGLDRGFAGGSARSAAMFGQALADEGGIGGFGQGSKEEIAALDMQLRQRAAASPLANMLGAVARMKEEGFVADDSEIGQLAAALEQGETTFQGRQIHTLTPAELRRMAEGSGVADSVLSNMLSANELNQETVQDMGLEGLVRRMQLESDIIPLQGQAASGAIASGLQDMLGMSRERARDLSGAVGDDVARAFFQMDPAKQDDPNERNKVLQESLKASLRRQGVTEKQIERMTPTQWTQLAGSAFASMARQREKHPHLQGYKSMNTLADVHNPAVVEQGLTRSIDARTEADLTEALRGIGQAPILERVTEVLRQGDNDMTWFQALQKAVANSVDMNTESGKAFQTLMRKFENAERDETGRLTDKGLRQRKELTRQLAKIAPGLEMAGSNEEVDAKARCGQPTRTKQLPTRVARASWAKWAPPPARSPRSSVSMATTP